MEDYDKCIICGKELDRGYMKKKHCSNCWTKIIAEKDWGSRFRI